MKGAGMRVKMLGMLTAVGAALTFVAGGAFAAGGAAAAAGTPARTGYEPVLNPGNFLRVINNPYYPLPVGRTLTYQGVRDGVTQTDRVHVTAQTRVLEGVTATTVTDVATHGRKVLEKTTDWFAQDKQGNVWYLGEDTTAYGRNGKTDTSGSWEAGAYSDDTLRNKFSHCAGSASYKSGLVDFTRLTQGQYQLLNAEMSEADANLQVWRALLDIGVAKGNLNLFTDQLK